MKTIWLSPWIAVLLTVATFIERLVAQTVPLDFGDAASNYGTTLAGNGPRHARLEGFQLGPFWDAETEARSASLLSNGDDNNPAGATDDEDGVRFLTRLVAGQPAIVEIVASQEGRIDAFVDFDRDLSFQDTDEQIMRGVVVRPGTNRLEFRVSVSAVRGNSTARFRLSKAGGLTHLGAAPDGEVEDYQVFISQPDDFGDAPDSYGTTFARNGARHGRDDLMTLGLFNDGEIEGLTGPNADGDDLSSSVDDEDGTTFLDSLELGREVNVRFRASTGGFIDGWVDFGRDGTWKEPGDQVFTKALVSEGLSTLKFRVPGDAKLGETFARFRLSKAGGLSFDGPAPEGEVEDHKVSLVPARQFDFGDGLASIGVLLADNGPRHLLNDNLKLGQRIDSEPDGQPGATATGDDTNPPGAAPDEDGVRFLTALTPGQPATVEITTALTGIASALVNGWIDYNRSGDLTQAGERFLVNRPVTNGPNRFTFTVPAAAILGNTQARFRLSSTSLTSPLGEAPDGEVEDYRVTIGEPTPPGDPLDYGDAPETAPSSFPTTLARDGARHETKFGQPNEAFVVLGTRVDRESDGQPNATATGDDMNDTNPAAPANDDDEEGVAFDGALTPGQTNVVRVVANAFAIEFIFLNAWIDFDGDGTWSQADNKIFNGQLLTPGTNVLRFLVPANARAGNTFSRFRVTGANDPVSPVRSIGFTGLVGIGECEDHPVTIEETQPAATLDFADAPEAAPANFPTTLARDGARHATVFGQPNQPYVLMGTRVDLEPDGQPNSAASGDDLNDTNPAAPANEDDEDGVTLAGPLVPGQTNIVRVVADAFAIEFIWLNAWVDFDGDGTWSQPNEKVFDGRQLVPGTNNLAFLVPANAKPGATYARFRITGANNSNSPLRSIGFTGLASIGEVEDYRTRIEEPEPDTPCDDDHRGTEFWLTFPGNYAPDPSNAVSLFLRIAGASGVTGTVTIPGLNFSNAFTIPASLCATVALPKPADLGDANDLIGNQGIHVTASDVVAVYAINQVDYTSDGYLALPSAALGRSYVVQTYGNVQTGVPELNGTQFALVACASNTVVTITPTATSGARAAGLAYDITLQAGQTYQLRHTGDAPGDLSGTIITATKPVAVFGSHRCANVQSTDTFFCDYLVEHLLPNRRAGTEFLTSPLATRTGDTFRFFALEDGTQVTVGTRAPVTLDAGEILEEVLTAGTRITSTQPILVHQFANSSDYDGETNADPFMVTVPNVNQFLSSYTVCTAGPEFATHYANVVIPVIETNSLQIDGAAVAAAFTTIPGSSYASAQIAISQGAHTFAAGAPFGLWIYGFSPFESYAWLGGIGLGDVQPPTVTCATNRVELPLGSSAAPPCTALIPDFRQTTRVTDNCRLLNDVIVNQEPPPGTPVGPGTYTVVLSAADAHGNVGTCEVIVVVTGGTGAPFSIRCPTRIDVLCDSPEGARVVYNVVAGADCQTNAPVVCEPPSGSVFPPGQTIVKCSALDSTGKVVTCEFPVFVQCPTTVSDIDIGPVSTDGVITIRLFADGFLETTEAIGRPWREVPVSETGPSLQGEGAASLESARTRVHRIRPAGEKGFFRIRKRSP